MRIQKDEMRKSLPMRERGLKFFWCEYSFGQIMSLPMRERGLKYEFLPAHIAIEKIAPHAGSVD